jgi:acyl-coenzyme A synthetase/AMP-(fatty) acid ligase
MRSATSKPSPHSHTAGGYMTSPPAYEKARTFGVRVFFIFWGGTSPEWTVCSPDVFGHALLIEAKKYMLIEAQFWPSYGHGPLDN